MEFKDKAATKLRNTLQGIRELQRNDTSDEGLQRGDIANPHKLRATWHTCSDIPQNDTSPAQKTELRDFVRSLGRSVHIGCVLAAGSILVILCPDWSEVKLLQAANPKL